MPRYDDNYEMWFGGAQLEKGSSPTPYVYTQYVLSKHSYDNRNMGSKANRACCGTASYIYGNLYNNQSALDVAKKLHNSVKFVGTFTTNSGITASVSATSDDPNTAAANDDTITDLDNESGIKVTKTYVVDQGADNLTNLGMLLLGR